jgi:hypothetical protein
LDERGAEEAAGGAAGALLMLEGVMDYSHSRSVYRLHPGDSQV